MLVLTALALTVLWTSGLFRPSSWSDPGNSSSLVPGLLLLAVALCGLWLAVVGDGADLQKWSGKSWMKAAGVTMALLAYVILFRLLGWVAASGILLVLTPLTLGYRRPVGNIVFAICLLVLIWLVFVQLMEVQLPRGIALPGL